MRITDLKTIALSYPLETPICNAGSCMDRRNALLVLVETDEGITGLGEACVSGGPIVTTRVIVEQELRPYLVGEDPLVVERLWDKMYRSTLGHGRRGAVIAAMSGIDIALWDIAGQRAGQPIYRLLGGYMDRVPAYASGGFYSPGKGDEELAEELRGYVRRGFRSVKIKVGRQAFRAEVARLETARAAVGPEVTLYTDASRVMRASDAIRFARELERLDIGWFEEPCSPDDIDGSARLAAATTVPIAGYETEFTRWGFRELIVRRAVSIVQPDVIWSGGFTECRKIAALASTWHLPCVPHAFSSIVSAMANLHLSAGIDNGGLFEFDQTANVLRTELGLDPLAIDGDGCVPLPQRPGLGVRLNPDIVARYRVDAG